MDSEALHAVLSRPASAHFVGVGGVGMAALAFVMRSLGWKVSGCDGARGPLLEWLRESGVEVAVGHSPDHVLREPPALVVRTPAVHDDAPELVAARAAGVPVVPRGEVLAALSGLFRTFAVCGSHGKTTTSSFLSAIMREAAPGTAWWCVGGTCGKTGTAVAGSAALPAHGSRPALVAEADESDGTLALYRPAVAVVTNVDLDHADRFPDVASFEAVFSEAFRRTSEAVVYCADHLRAAALALGAETAARRVSFGFSPGADWRVSDWTALPGGSSRFVLHPPAPAAPVEVSLPLPGRHNALNAAAAVAAANEAGISPGTAAAALGLHAALPDRRFEFVGAPEGFSVVSDYSHHPVEIAALVETARSFAPGRVLAVFQPHRYTRTKALLDEFPPAFAGVDALVLCPVYAASEDHVPGGTSADLYAAFRRNQDAPVPVLAQSLDEAFRFLSGQIRAGDMVLVVGAGDVVSLAPRLAGVRPVAEPAPMPPVSAYGTAAPVAAFREVSTTGEIRAALDEARSRGLAVAVAGAGTNLLVAPAGFGGMLLRLRRDGFFFISPHVEPGADEASGDRWLDVGAATPGRTLLDYCRSMGLSGIECMAGIPGVVGGWLAMNAGVRDGAFGDAVESALAVRVRDGTQVRLCRDELRFSYRECAGLDGHVALSVRLRLRAADPAAVAAKTAAFSAKRLDLSGHRTCGSVFKNPGGGAPSAGALSDAAGCKGLSVGGASVTVFHGNIVETRPGAVPSDVLALLSLVHDRVLASSGVDLSPELRVLS